MGVRIQELPATSGIKKEDVLIVEDGQGTKKGTVQQLDEALGVSQLKEDLVEIFELEIKNGRYTVGGNELDETSWKKCVNHIPIDLDNQNVTNTNKLIYIVDKKGNGDFKTINEAVKYCKPIATKDNRITIQINPGIYDEVVLVDDSWLSFVGTNRDTCIIRDTSGKYANSPMRITGDFYIANLTFIANADNVDPNWSPSGYNPSGPVMLDYPSYALHVDGDTNHVDSVGRIVNCSFYSECFQAIGIGLHNTQTLIIENCSIVRNTTRDDFLDNQYNGAIGCHSTLNENEKYQSFILENCDIKYNHDYALQLHKYHSTSPMTAKCVGNTLESGGTNLVYFKNCTNEIITSTSHGNNSHDINKFS